jgi:hypothetical protein
VPTPPRTESPDRQLSDSYRLTWLSAERTWLAWCEPDWAIFVIGAVRQRHREKTLHHSAPVLPLGPLVMWLTVAAIALMTATFTLLAIGV